MPAGPPRFARGKRRAIRSACSSATRRPAATCAFVPGLRRAGRRAARTARQRRAGALRRDLLERRRADPARHRDRTARQMDHLPISGPDGSLERLARLPAAHRVYTHINNTNPMLARGFPGARRGRAAGLVDRRGRHAVPDPRPRHDRDARRLPARHASPATDPGARPPAHARRSWRRRCASFHGSYYVQHPFHQLMYAGTLTPRQFQGWVANRLAYQRVVPRKDAAILSNCPDPDVRREWIEPDHRPRRDRAGHGRHRALDPAWRGARRAARGDGGRAARAARGAAHLRVVRHVLQDQAVGGGGGGVAHRAVRAQDPPAADRGVSQALPVDSARGAGLLQEPAGAGSARRDATASPSCRPHCTTVETQRKAFEALAFKLDMLWAMIDTIHNAYREE